MRKWTILLVACALLLTTACSKPNEKAASDKPIIKIGYLPITHAGPLYMDAYLQEDYTIEMVKFGSWPDLMDALNTGRIDGASALIELAMKAKEQGIDLKAVALGHTDGNVLISSHDIDTTADLQGKTYAIPHKFSSHNILLNEMLKKDGMTYEDVNVVEMAPAEMPAALSENRIAGYVVAEPFGAQAVVLNKGQVHYHSDEIWPDSYCCVLVMRNDFITKNPDVTQSFINHYALAGELANQKDDVVYESFGQFMKVDREVLDLSLEWISYDNLRIEQQDYDKLSGFMVEMGLSDQPPSYEEFVDNTFIEKAK
ncbi:ABC transporter substrate-binding protein [Sporosarcina sp. FSL K6-3457]|uniref:ABC transporter substrate-binding protein n=1 Tax=Sporosarcina sp. FSL K6-3457 TaxID=2978204 RepID=UPI0030F66B17